MTSRRSSLAGLVAALAVLAICSACVSFIGGHARAATRETKTALRAWARVRPHDLMYRKSTAKDRQAARSVEMAKKGDDEDDEEAEKEKVKQIAWPLQSDDGAVKLHLHVEYDEEHGVFPQPGNLEVEKFYRDMNRRFGSKIRIIHNEPTALMKTIPADDDDDVPKPRRGSFEVIDASQENGDVLFSKLKTGSSLVSPYVLSGDPYMEKWMDKLAAKYNLDAEEADAAEAAAEEVPAEEPVDA
eukprot:TRINITY_DN84704_c0_g1_i1.p1 TRINITY_DN84704_c0_g1~~TRINITY_DN84704_c0_g1_i1.p1  ORF type:complete len:259 (-),score=84.03 TRINITY_DN84704_c0_g1_i1:339-1067(-)